MAKALAGRLPSSVILNKDDIRAAMFPTSVADYSEAQNALAMAALLSAAARLCSHPPAPAYLFIDGRTFSRADHISDVIRFAEDHAATWTILHLWCPENIAFQRLAASHADHPAQNRNQQLYASLQKSFEPILQPHLSLDTSLPLDQTLQAALTWLGA